jgi:hypothetical protein
MSKTFRILKFTIALIFFVLFAGTGCASVLKTKFNHKKKDSYCNLAQLVGPDKYYYSDRYQRKLKKSTKRIGKK